MLIANTSDTHILKGGDRKRMLSLLIGFELEVAVAVDVDDTGTLTFISGLANREQ